MVMWNRAIEMDLEVSRFFEVLESSKNQLNITQLSFNKGSVTNLG